MTPALNEVDMFEVSDGKSVRFQGATPRLYSDLLTAEVNGKGVLDVDTVKGCTAGMGARPNGGCYNACYAATIAKFRGIDFSRSVVRHVRSKFQALKIEKAVRESPYGFFRIGTMGDPCHAWLHTVEVVEWLAPFATPVIITKHWVKALDQHLSRLVACGTVLNTSISALDTPAELAYRERQIDRYEKLGGVSVSRIVSCDFNRSHPEGGRMAVTQDRLFALKNVIDNPLRIPRTHDLFRRGVLRLSSVKDLDSVRTVSLAKPDTYLGHCRDCPDQCGLSVRKHGHPQPKAPQAVI